jgi:integrase
MLHPVAPERDHNGTTDLANARLTSTKIEAAKAAAKRYELNDPTVPGLQLRVEPSGRKVWLLRYYWQGKRVRYSIGAWPSWTQVKAHEAATEARRQLDQGIDPRRSRSRRRNPPPADASLSKYDPHSIEFLAHEFIERFVKPNRKRPQYVERILKADVLSKDAWAGRDARTITPRQVIERLDEIVARGSPVQANRTAAILSQMFRFGVHRAIVDASPVQLLYKPGGKERSRERALTDDELRAFLEHRTEACKAGHMPHVLTVLLLTLQRRGELGLAEWREFDFKAKLWRIPDEHAKGGRGHTLPLTHWAVDELQALKKLAGRSRFVLPNSEGDAPADPKLITRSVARCQTRFKKVGIEPFTIHDFRRTGRTAMARLGVRTDIAERVLNHAREKMEGTYDVHQYVDEKLAALLSWEKHLQSIAKR